MAISKEEVQHIVKLAKLSLSEQEVELISHQLDDILNYMGRLNQVDTTDLPACSYIAEQAGFLRSDHVQPSLTIEQIEKNAPEISERKFMVPKIIG